MALDDKDLKWDLQPHSSPRSGPAPLCSGPPPSWIMRPLTQWPRERTLLGQGHLRNFKVRTWIEVQAFLGLGPLSHPYLAFQEILCSPENLVSLLVPSGLMAQFFTWNLWSHGSGKRKCEILKFTSIPDPWELEHTHAPLHPHSVLPKTHL